MRFLLLSAALQEMLFFKKSKSPRELIKKYNPYATLSKPIGLSVVWS